MPSTAKHDHSLSRSPVRRILELIAECVVTRTPFLRVVVSLYEDELDPGSENSETRVIECACRGVSDSQKRDLLAFVDSGGIVSGRRYRPPARRGDSFYFRHGDGLRPVPLLLKSSRTFFHPDGWHADDVLLTPLWANRGIIGQISADDPLDGAQPTADVFRQLDKLASLASAALQDARELERLSERHRVFRFLTESALTGVLVIRDESIQYVNGQACEILGYKRDELLTLNPWWQLLHPDDRPSAWTDQGRLPDLASMTRAIRRDGRTIWLTSSLYAMEHEPGSAFVVQFYDTTDRVETEALLKEKALRDPLTGLLNRSYFEDAIRTELERSKRYKRPLTLMMGDLARFKLVNDRLGHQEGDRVLKGLAGVVLQQLRDSDWVVRYGGDEFLFVLPETGLGISTVEDRLSQAVIDWCAGDVADVQVEMDFGWSTWTPDRDCSVAELIREADTMLYSRKANRANDS